MITTTFPDKKSAQKIAKLLLESQKAACVQILPDIETYYVWNNEVVHDTEVLVLIKTMQYHFSAIETCILQHHPYEVPQIISFKVDNIHTHYAQWLKKTINK